MCEAVHSSIFAMEGDDDDDNLFNIDDDDEEMDREPTVADILAVDDTPVASAEPMAGTADGTGVAGVSSAPLEDPVMGEEEGDEEGGMGNDPYNEHEWDVLEGEMAEEAETSALLFDGDDSLDKDHDVGDADGYGNDEDLNSLMDRGLEEVDDLLNTKGRLSVFGPPHASSGERAANAGSRKTSSVLTAHETAATGGGIAQQEGEVHVPHPTTTTARGAGANAASVLTSTTDPSGPSGTKSGTATYHPTASASALVQQGLGGLSRSAMASDQKDGVVPRDRNNNNYNHNFESPNGEDNLERRQNGVQSYHYDTRVTVDPGGNDVNLSPPPRRRARDTAPYLQAKGLTLTYAQAKLFGLHAAGSPPTPATLTNGDRESPHVINGANATWPGPGPRRAKIAGSTSTGLGWSTRDGEERQHRGHVRTYSPVRMERLARPVPGRDRAGGAATAGNVGAGGPLTRDQGTGRGTGDAAFTWKRSKRAEAAMRDPACGYDFVRESGYSKEEFLRRVEAYSSYSRHKLETMRGEAAYAARVDKLECPQCGNPQSYDEFISKKLKCGGCDLAYRMPRTWNRRVWDQRNEMCAMKSEERKARIERRAEEDFLGRLPRQTRHAALLRQRVGQVGFIRRMRRDLQRRRAREGRGIVNGKSRDNAQDDGDSQRRRPNQYEQKNYTVNRPASAPPATNRGSRRGQTKTAGGGWAGRHADSSNNGGRGSNDDVSPARAALQPRSLPRSPLPAGGRQSEEGMGGNGCRSPYESAPSRPGSRGVSGDGGSRPRDCNTDGVQDGDFSVWHRARRPRDRPFSADAKRPASAERSTAVVGRTDDMTRGPQQHQ